MKHRFIILISALYLLLIFSSGCVMLPVQRTAPQHKRRNVWVNDVYYNQVYYIQDGKTVIVEQKQVPGKKYKKQHDNGKHKGQRKH